MKHLGITPAYAGVLYFAQKSDTPYTITQLRKLIGRSNSSIVGIINRMERDGLIKRLTNSKNKKYTRVFLTEEKQALYKKALDLNAFTSIFSNLSGEERQNLKKYLDSLKNKAQSVVEEKHNNKRKK